MNEEKKSAGEEWARIGFMAGATAAMGAVAFFLGELFDEPAFDNIEFSLSGVLIGVGATAPMIAFLMWFMRTTLKTIVDFRESQIAFFSEIGFRFTWPRMIILAAAAGIFEEVLFRGFLQDWAAAHAPMILAIIGTNIIFGLLHWRTALYAGITFVIGCYLGALYAVTGNLLVPIITHGLYDLYAFAITQREVDRRRLNAANDARPDPVAPPSPDNLDRPES